MSIAFALGHAGQPLAAPAIIFLSVLLGVLYEAKGSLAWPIALHALFNLRTMLWEQLGS